MSMNDHIVHGTCAGRADRAGSEDGSQGIGPTVYRDLR